MNSLMKILWVLSLLGLGATANSIAEDEIPSDRAACPGGSYSPCICEMNSNGLVLLCALQKSIASVTTLLAKRFPANVDSLSIILQSADHTDGIPKNVLNGKAINSLTLFCVSDKELKVDPAALASTAGTLQSLKMDGCNLTSTELSFLRNFTKLNSLTLTNAIGLQTPLITLPPLPALTSLVIESATNLSDVYVLPKLATGLESLTILQRKPASLADTSNMSCPISPLASDEAIGRLLYSVFPSSSRTLKSVALPGNGLILVPSHLAMMPNLISLDLTDNILRGIDGSLQTGSFPIAASSPQTPFLYLSMANARLSSIDKGAFAPASATGLSWTLIDLSNNLLTRFEYDAFYLVLTQMAAYNVRPPPNFNGVPKLAVYSGFIDVTGNPFDCTKDLCWLTWIVVKYPNLLNYVNGAVCADGTPWNKVDPAALKKCPV